MERERDLLGSLSSINISWIKKIILFASKIRFNGWKIDFPNMVGPIVVFLFAIYLRMLKWDCTSSRVFQKGDWIFK